jgi:hypothetical protein
VVWIEYRKGFWTNKPVTETLETETEIIKRVTRIREKRKNTDEQLERQAKQTLTNAERLFGHAQIDDCVALFTCELDRGLSDAPNILCRVYDKKESNYQLACEAGTKVYCVYTTLEYCVSQWIVYISFFLICLMRPEFIKRL